MINQKTVNLFYYSGLALLIYDIYKSFQVLAYWEIFKDLIFIFIVIYMIFIYPKRRLNLTEDLFSILFVYFIAYGIRSFFDAYFLGIVVSLIYTVGIIVYKVYRKKHKYSFYLKK